MATISAKRLQSYRAETFQTRAGRRLRDKDQAVEFVDRRGFIFFWPIKDVLLPSLWTAVAGDRPIPDNHDDPGHITWDWKDSLLGTRRWYYARVLRRRNTIISLETAPYFYALSENYGAWEEDYLYLYEQGRLTLESKSVYEALLQNGPLDTIALRKAARLSGTGSDGRFNRALDDLQIDFKILPVGVANAGSWHYAFIYDIVPRHLPNLPEQAHAISERLARQELARRYWRSLGAATFGESRKCLGWRDEDLRRAVEDLDQAGELTQGALLENQPGELIALTELV